MVTFCWMMDDSSSCSDPAAKAVMSASRIAFLVGSEIFAALKIEPKPELIASASA